MECVAPSPQFPSQEGLAPFGPSKSEFLDDVSGEEVRGSQELLEFLLMKLSLFTANTKAIGRYLGTSLLTKIIE